MMSKRMSRVCRVCRRVVSVRPVSAGANEWWKGRLRPKCNIMLSSLFPNESTSRASIALYCPLLSSKWGALCGREWAGSAPDIGQARAGELLSTAGRHLLSTLLAKKKPTSCPCRLAATREADGPVKVQCPLAGSNRRPEH